MKDLLFCTFIISFLSACAQVASPTGGPKDKTPPELVKSTPAIGAVKFSGQILKLTFNESIEAKNLKQQLTISPYIKNPYTAEIKKNNLTIKFEDPFQKNTTYSIYFIESIVDITEKNPAENLRLLFSTGQTIDSLSVGGMLKNLITNEPVQNATVMLYDSEDTFDLNDGFPFYFIKSNEKGIYLFENIRRGDYKLYALKEKDNNFHYSEREESIAFLNTILVLDTIITNFNLKLNSYDNKIFRYVNTRTKGQYISINFNKNFVDYQVNYADTSWKNNIKHWKEKESIVLYYKTQKQTDSIKTFIQVIDSIGQTVSDTIKIVFKPFKEKEKKPFKIKTDPQSGSTWIPKNKYDIKFKFSKPVKYFQKDSVSVVSGEDTTKFEQNFITNLNRTEWVIPEVIINEEIVFLFKKGSFISVENDTLEKISLQYSLKKEEKYGIVAGNIISDSLPFIVQLLNARYQVIDTVYNREFYVFNYVYPGHVYIRVIEDSNANRVWDTGSFEKKTQAEPAYFFPDKITVKANWELLDINININEKQENN